MPKPRYRYSRQNGHATFWYRFFGTYRYPNLYHSLLLIQQATRDKTSSQQSFRTRNTEPRRMHPQIQGSESCYISLAPTYGAFGSSAATLFWAMLFIKRFIWFRVERPSPLPDCVEDSMGFKGIFRSLCFNGDCLLFQVLCHNGRVVSGMKQIIDWFRSCSSSIGLHLFQFFATV